MAVILAVTKTVTAMVLANVLPAVTVAVVFAVATTGTVSAILANNSGNGSSNIRGRTNNNGSAVSAMGGLAHAMQACSIGSKGSCSTALLHVYLAVMNENTVGASYCWHQFLWRRIASFNLYLLILGFMLAMG